MSEVPKYHGRVKPSLISKALSRFNEYKSAKTDLMARVKDNNRLYRQQYARMYNPTDSTTHPATGFVFSAVENKFADAVDNFPVPNVLEREERDEYTAQLLSKILPVQLDESDFKHAYKKVWRSKLKHGTGIYGVFYNDSLATVDITAPDILNVYVDMHIEDPQDSQFLFICNAIDNDTLCAMYPRYRALFEGTCTVDTVEGSNTLADHTIITDCYYKRTKRTQDGRIVKQVHLIKLCGEHVIDASLDHPQTADGLYSHGLYPVVFDTLYPIEGCPFGFGLIDVIKNPQAYVDKLDGLIIRNAMISGKQRFIVRDSGGINEQEFLDYSRDIIHAAGSIEDNNVRAFQASALPAFVMTHRKEKIDELKEVVGNRDFQQGGVNSNVTSGTAINMLQQAGEKLSRSMIDSSYDAYAKVVLMVIELMREFYTQERVYRITGQDGVNTFEAFDSDMLYHQERDAFGIVADKKPALFDVEVIPEKKNPLTREVTNEMLLKLWSAGLLTGQAPTAKAVLECMNFEGKEKLLKSLG